MTTTPQATDSRKRWAVLYMAARHSGGYQVLPEQTEYYWTRRGAKRRAATIGRGPQITPGNPLWKTKVVRNA